MAESILEQLRVQDGKLFQNEQVMTLYVDTKRLVLDNILLALSTNSDLNVFVEWSPEIEKHLVASLTCSPKLLENVLQFYSSLLDSTHVQSKHATIGVLLKGLFQRICKNPNVKTGNIQMLDPIKQDFVCREIFRSTLVCDCMISADLTKDLTKEVIIIEAPVEEKILEDRILEEEEIGPDDSASQCPKETATVLSSTSTMLTATLKKPKNIRRIVLDDDAYSSITKLR